MAQLGTIPWLNFRRSVLGAVGFGNGMSRWSTAGKAFAGFAAAMALIIALAAVTYRAADGFVASSRLLDQTHQVLACLENTEAALYEAIAANRLYVITESPDAIVDRDRALSRMNASLQNVREFTMENPAQQARLRVLEKAIGDRRDLMDDVVFARQTGGIGAARAMMLGEHQRLSLAAIAAAFRDIESEERSLRALRKQADDRAAADIPLALAALLSGAALLLGCLFLWITRDLAQRGRMEAEIHEANNLLSSIVDNIPHMIFLKDARELRFVRINKAAEELIGISRDQLLGTRDVDWFPSNQAATFIQRDREVLGQRGVADIVEEPLDTRSQGTRILHTKKLAILDSSGKPSYLLGISEDVTERRARERETLALNAMLQQQAQELETANKELESFSYSVSHDLRSPLRAIEGFARMLEEDFSVQLPQEARRYIATIQTGTRKMASLIDDLLAFSKVSRQELRCVPVDMRGLVVQASREVIGEAGTAPVLSIGPLPAAAGDPALLKQVWLNLVGNAAKYSATRSDAAIEISGRLQGAEALYQIKDNGVGFDPRYRDKLFGVFQRLHRAEDFAGTGVGLAIVHRIVTRHGGRVWAESELGQGATFYFALPAAANA